MLNAKPQTPNEKLLDAQSRYNSIQNKTIDLEYLYAIDMFSILSSIALFEDIEILHRLKSIAINDLSDEYAVKRQVIDIIKEIEAQYREKYPEHFIGVDERNES